MNARGVVCPQGSRRATRIGETRPDVTEKLIVDNVTKVFGPEPERALEMLRTGRSKTDILCETGTTVGVSGVSFRVAAGEIFVVMGLSGSGKSTLVRMINRLIEPTSGEILIDGESVTGADAAALRRIRLDKVAMVFQHFALFPHRTVRQNVEFGLKTRGVDPETRRARALAALEQVGLEAWADRPPRALSGGMQQRVGLARGLAVDPEILLMDEPFSALDPLIRGDMQRELIELQQTLHKTIVFITHDLNEALILGDRIAIMNEGRFVQVGTGEEIVGSPADDYVAEFTRDTDRGRVFAAEAVMRPAEPLDLAADTAASGLERMERLGRDALYVLEDGRVAGVLTYRDLSAAARRNGADLAALLVRDYPSAGRRTHLHRLFGRCTGGLPVAVLEEDGRLAGVAEPEAILARLAPERGAPERQEA
jgi:glycine betaine/proline transport system ATP-binding protein